jgi:phosphate transport system permease protein
MPPPTSPFTSQSPTSPREASSSGFDFRDLGDRVFWGICRTATLFVVVLAFLLVAVLIAQSLLSIRTTGIRLLTTTTWDPVEAETRAPTFGALAFIYGTLATSAIAMLIAVPLGVGTAAFLAEIAPPRVRAVASFLVEMLAAIPSVVYGFWGLFFLAPGIQQLLEWLGQPTNTGGLSIFTAGLILAIMIVPYVSAVSFDACRAVPRSQREGSLALGATRWQSIRSVILPYARPGIVGGCFLALGRALGETMAVTMLIGNRPDIAWSPFAAGDSIASALANKFKEANSDLEISVLVELGLVLLGVTVVVNTLARLLIWRVGHVGRRSLFTRRITSKKAAPSTGGPTTAPAPPPPDSTGAQPHKAQATDRLMTCILGLALVITLGPLFLILGYLVYRGIGAVNWDFFVELPVGPDEPGGGLANALVGSTLLVGFATLAAVPLGLLAAVYLAEYRRGPQAPAVGSRWELAGDYLGALSPLAIVLAAFVILGWPFHLDGGQRLWALAALAGLAAIGVGADYRAGRMGSASAGIERVQQALPTLAIGLVAFALLQRPFRLGPGTGFFVLSGLMLAVAAVHLAEARTGWLGPSVRFIGELLAGVPSIVIGLFAFTLIRRPFHLYGWAGVFALGVMMIPIVMRASEESLKLVPRTLRNASYALGASQWQTVVRVCVPAALPAIITGVFLAIARIGGETAPLLLTSGSDDSMPDSLAALNDYTPALPIYIYNYSLTRYENWQEQAWAAAFVLLVLVMLLNFGTRFFTGRRVVLASRAAKQKPPRRRSELSTNRLK